MSKSRHRPPRKGRNSGSGGLLIGGALLLLVLALVGTRVLKPRGGEDAEAPQAIQAPAVAAVAPDDAAKPKLAARANAAAEERRVVDLIKAADQLGMERMPLEKSGSGYKLSVQLKVERRCGDGDLDAMKIIAKATGQTKFLVTLEPIDGRDRRPDTERIDVRDLERTRAIDFNVDANESPRRLGLYICYDPQGTNRCGDKPALDMGQFLAQADPFNLARKKLEPKASILFFQPIETSQGSAQFIASRSPEHAPQWNKDYVAYATKRYGIDAAAAAAPLKTYDTANSLPLQATDGSVVVPLPMHDSRLCSSGGATP